MVKSDMVWRAGGPRMTYTQVDDNLRRLAYWSGLWSAGTYEANEMVEDGYGNLWIANKQTTEQPIYIPGNPPTLPVDWDGLSRTAIGYGQANATTPLAILDIGAGWQTLPIDEISIGGPSVDFDIAADTFSVSAPGIWDVLLQLNMSHNSSNSGRTTNCRVVIASDATELGRVVIGIGRDQQDTFVNVSTWISVVSANLGVALRWEIGGGDSITGVSLNGLVERLQRID